MEYFRQFSPQSREQAIRCLTVIYPNDVKKFKRMKYNQLYAIFKKSGLKMYGTNKNPTQSKEMKVSHTSQRVKALCRMTTRTSAVGRATAANCISQNSIWKGR